MKFIIKNLLKENIYNLMKKVGYHFQREDKRKNELIFVQSLEEVVIQDFIFI